jgi:catechol 2,3-dioxygenase-like lactoylglutathione lyase family enzyme
LRTSKPAVASTRLRSTCWTFRWAEAPIAISGYDELFVSAPDGPEATGQLTGRHHLAFQAKDRDTVDAFYKAGLAAGGRDNGAPGERPNYHPGYYAAFLLDPDGNNIEAVYHGKAERSAPSVEISFPAPAEPNF